MRGFITLGLTALLLFGCSSDSQQGKSDQPVSDADAQLAHQAAARIVNDYGQSLKTELISAMNESGPAGAIAVCQVKAPELTRDFQMDQIWSINRVSERNRNPENAADSLQRSILAKFADTSDTPIDEYGMWTTEEGGLVYHYYKPIRTMSLCLNCHGDVNTIDPEVKAMLEKKYPEDNAVGYGENELRGMFVVDLYWPDARTPAEKMLAGTLE